jgi:hypothetical protein
LHATAIVGAVLDAVDLWAECAERAMVGPKARDEVGADILEMAGRLR